MKYSIRGNIRTEHSIPIIDTINQFTLWRLVYSNSQVENENYFSFEVWVNNSNDKDALFDSLKPYVDLYGDEIDWHECTHDEEIPQPCVIAESYVRGD